MRLKYFNIVRDTPHSPPTATSPNSLSPFTKTLRSLRSPRPVSPLVTSIINNISDKRHKKTQEDSNDNKIEPFTRTPSYKKTGGLLGADRYSYSFRGNVRFIKWFYNSQKRSGQWTPSCTGPSAWTPTTSQHCRMTTGAKYISR